MTQSLEQDVNKTLTHSAAKAFRNCPRQYLNRYERQIVPIKSDVASLGIGAAVHEALEAWFDPASAGIGIIDGLQMRESKREPILSLIDHRFPNRFMDQEQKKRWHLARAMFAAYSRLYTDEPFEVIAVERQFKQPLRNPKTGRASKSFFFEGKVDAVIRLRSSGEYYVMEHKTASVIDGNYVERLPLDTQISLYSHFLGLEMGIPITGVLYDVIGKTGISQSIGETEEEYQERLADLIAKSKTGKSSAKRRMPEDDEEFQARLAERYDNDRERLFLRQYLYLSHQDIQAHIQELWDVSQRILESRRRQTWMRNTDRCFDYFRPCAYFPLCRSHDNPNLVENMYEVRPAHSELASDDDSHSNATPAF